MCVEDILNDNNNSHNKWAWVASVTLRRAHNVPPSKQRNNNSKMQYKRQTTELCIAKVFNRPTDRQRHTAHTYIYMDEWKKNATLISLVPLHLIEKCMHNEISCQQSDFIPICMYVYMSIDQIERSFSRDIEIMCLFMGLFQRANAKWREIVYTNAQHNNRISNYYYYFYYRMIYVCV